MDAETLAVDLGLDSESVAGVGGPGSAELVKCPASGIAIMRQYPVGEILRRPVHRQIVDRLLYAWPNSEYVRRT